MKIHVVTLFPEMISQALQFGLLGQSLKKNLLSVSCVNPREFAGGVHKAVDDRPYGGGDGMVMTYGPLAKTLQSLGVEAKGMAAEALHEHPTQKPRVIYLSPQGAVLTPSKARELSNSEFILVCGRYGGIDQRWLNDFVDEELSIGDYVLNGGELAALVVIEAAMRFLPGALGHGESAEKDSFSQPRLESPQFTRPEVVNNQVVPAVLRSGHHQKQEEWREKISLLMTGLKRPDLSSWACLDSAQKKELKEFFRQLSVEERRALGFPEGADMKLFGEEKI